MKHFLTVTFNVLSLIIILDSINFAHSIVMFLLAGIIPGTNITMNADQMLVLFAALSGLVCGRISVRIVTSLRRRLVQYSQPKAVVLAE